MLVQAALCRLARAFLRSMRALFWPKRSLCWPENGALRPSESPLRPTKGLFRQTKAFLLSKTVPRRPVVTLFWPGRPLVSLLGPFAGQIGPSFGLRGPSFKRFLCWPEKDLFRPKRALYGRLRPFNPKKGPLPFACLTSLYVCQEGRLPAREGPLSG